MCQHVLHLERHNLENSEERNIHNIECFFREVLELSKPMMIVKVLR